MSQQQTLESSVPADSGTNEAAPRIEFFATYLPGLLFFLFVACLILVRPSSLGRSEMFLCGGLTLVAALSALLLREHLRSLATARAESLEAIGNFEAHLVSLLRFPGSGALDFEALAESFGISAVDASRVAERIFARFAARVVADGVITPAEREKMDGLGRLLRIPPGTCDFLLQTAKGQHYRSAVAEVLEDGIVTDTEASRLDSLRSALGIDADHGLAVAGDLARESYLSILRQIVSTGSFDPAPRRLLFELRRGLALKHAEAVQLIQDQCVPLFSQAFANVLSDGIVTPEEEAFLNWLREEIGLSDQDARPFYERLGVMKTLANCRSGQLPVVATKKLLEGGELCHWDSDCAHDYQTPTKIIQVSGSLLVTNKRVVFNSPTKNFSFSPWKIYEIESGRRSVRLKVDARSGSGAYLVSTPEMLDAILTGLAKKTKFATNPIAAAASRHIPREVKAEVWTRDRGQCVYCGASGRGACLEFDHIIPHSLGGSNHAPNIQLLCRSCNAAKSDRI